MEKDNGDMTTGLMCLGCGRITPANDGWWSWCYDKFCDKSPPVVRLMCPDCRFISPVNVNYLTVERQ